MKIEVIKLNGGRKIYRRKGLSNRGKFNLYCIGCGILIVLMIVIAVVYR